MIHEVRIYEIAPGAMSAYIDAFEKYLLPLCRRHMRLLGVWTTDTGDLNRFYTLWVFENEQARRSQNIGMKSDPQFSEYLSHILPLLRNMTSIMLNPVPLDGDIPIFQATSLDLQPFLPQPGHCGEPESE